MVLNLGLQEQGNIVLNLRNKKRKGKESPEVGEETEGEER